MESEGQAARATAACSRSMTAAIGYFQSLVSIYESQIESRVEAYLTLCQSYRYEREQFRELQAALASSSCEPGLTGPRSFDSAGFYLEVLSSMEKKRQSLASARQGLRQLAEPICRLLQDYQKFTMQGKAPSERDRALVADRAIFSYIAFPVASYTNYSFKTSTAPEFRLVCRFIELASELLCYVRSIEAFDGPASDFPRQLAFELAEFKKTLSWLALLSSPLVSLSS